MRGGERDGQSADIRDARKAAATTFRAFKKCISDSDLVALSNAMLIISQLLLNP